MLVPPVPVQNAIARAGAVRDAVQMSSQKQMQSLRRLVRAIHIRPNEMVIAIDAHSVIGETGSTSSDQAEQPEHDPVTVSVPMMLRRRGAEAKLVLEGNSLGRKPDDGLVAAVAKAHVMLGMLTDGSDKNHRRCREGRRHSCCRRKPHPSVRLPGPEDHRRNSARSPASRTHSPRLDARRPAPPLDRSAPALRHLKTRLNERSTALHDHRRRNLLDTLPRQQRRSGESAEIPASHRVSRPTVCANRSLTV
jgi:hypothetical protein